MTFQTKKDAVQDMKHRLLRCHNAKGLIEDQLRMLQIVRIAARLSFRIDKVTHSLIRSHIQGLGYVTRKHVALELEKAYSQVKKPSDYFRLLAELGALEILYSPLAALQNVPAGPEIKRHGKNSAFDHTMEAIDRAKAKGYDFGVFLAVLCHDFGKAVTPKNVLPHHYGHEKRSEAIAKEWFQLNRFRKSDAELAVAFARQHMKVHVLEEMRPARLVRFARAIQRKYLEDFFNAGDCDSPLNERQWQIVRALEHALAEGGRLREVGSGVRNVGA